MTINSKLYWSRQLKRAKTTRDIVDIITKMNPTVNCTHEAYIICLAMAAVDYMELLAKEEAHDEVES